MRAVCFNANRLRDERKRRIVVGKPLIEIVVRMHLSTKMVMKAICGRE